MNSDNNTSKPSDKAADPPKAARKHISLRKLLSWLVVAAVVAFGIYWFRFRSIPVMTHAKNVNQFMTDKHLAVFCAEVILAAHGGLLL